MACRLAYFRGILHIGGGGSGLFTAPLPVVIIVRISRSGTFDNGTDEWTASGRGRSRICCPTPRRI